VTLSNLDIRAVVSKRFASLSTTLAAIAFGVAFAGQALAQTGASSPTGGLGAQLNTISGEAINAGGTAFGMGCYLAAASCFGLGVWSLWQSRQPQHREAGHIGRGITGLVLAGLFATSGVYVNKAAVTASGGNATITTTPQMVQFANGGG